MSKKSRRFKKNITKQPVVKENGTWFKKLRPFLFPMLFGVGVLVANWINENELMYKVGSEGNIGIQVTWAVEVCTYLCIAGLIILGWQFETKLEERENKK